MNPEIVKPLMRPGTVRAIAEGQDRDVHCGHEMETASFVQANHYDVCAAHFVWKNLNCKKVDGMALRRE